MMRCFQGDRKMKHGKKCKIDKYTLILIVLSHFDAIRRTSGFLETGAELPLNQKGNILAEWKRELAYEKFAALDDEAVQNVEAVICNNDDMALGVVKALQEKDMKDQVMVVGVDFTEEAKAAIEDGTYDATVAMSPYLMGREAVIMMLKALEGQEVTSIGDSTPMALVNADNVAEMSDWH